MKRDLVGPTPYEMSVEDEARVEAALRDLENDIYAELGRLFYEHIKAGVGVPVTPQHVLIAWRMCNPQPPTMYEQMVARPDVGVILEELARNE